MTDEKPALTGKKNTIKIQEKTVQIYSLSL